MFFQNLFYKVRRFVAGNAIVTCKRKYYAAQREKLH